MTRYAIRDGKLTQVEDEESSSWSISSVYGMSIVHPRPVTVLPRPEGITDEEWEDIVKELEKIVATKTELEELRTQWMDKLLDLTEDQQRVEVIQMLVNIMDSTEQTNLGEDVALLHKLLVKLSQK